MNVEMENWVPKVHPLSRGAEAEDPIELVASPVVGDSDLMLEAVVQEFSQMGLDAAELLEMFQSPAYPILRQIGDRLGERELRRRIEQSLSRTGVFRVHETILEPEDEEDEDGELIQLKVRRSTTQSRASR
jgi:hypothetical protein